MNFQKYTHLERFGTDEVDGINIGECYIFPKLDGTNASVWINEEGLQAGSRNRLLSLDDDNAGFKAYVFTNGNIRDCLEDNPTLRLFGEFLVKHSLSTYRGDAWRKFYIFDVCDAEGNYLKYEDYLPILQKYSLDFIPCTTKAKNPTYEQLQHCLENNRYLIQEGQGTGEGIVIKNYDYRNRFGRLCFAKMVTNTFKDKHIEVMGGNVIKTKLVEEEICDEFVTEHTIEKCLAKIRLKEGSFGSKQIPMLLGMVYHDLIVEEMWEILKKHKNPKIDFKTLSTCCIRRIKEIKNELFGK